jgi:hypothetical protein
MSFDGDSDAVYAWAAGILEGEGCFSIHRRKDRSNTLNTAIHCEMTDEDIIRRLHAVFKVGTVNARKKYVWPQRYARSQGHLDLVSTKES